MKNTEGGRGQLTFTDLARTVPTSSGTIWYSMSDTELDTIFGALADSTRRAILARLVRGEASVAELAKPFELTPRAISKHVAVLEAAGLVERSRDAQRRPTRICADRLIEVDRWLGSYRGLWNDRFERLSKRLASQQKGKRT